MEERGGEVDHSTINRWVIQDSPQLEEACQRRKRAVGVSWQMDKPDIQGKGEWRARSRAVDTHGQTMDFLLTAPRDTEAAWRFLKQAIRRNGRPATSPIDGSDAKAAASKRDNEEHGTTLAIRQGKYLNHGVEHDHRAVTRVPRPLLGFKSLDAAQCT
jgi:putative transposase